MKKLLPILFFCVFSVVALLAPTLSYAVDAPPSLGVGTPADGQWIIDPEVTFIGKNAARAGHFLDWTLRNYNWVCVKRVVDPNNNQAFQCDDSKNPIQTYWSLIMVYIVVPLLFIVLLGSAVVIIITRGRGLSVMRFIPRFVAVIVLIVFSYAIVQFFFQFADVIQGFFLRIGNNPCPPECISQKELLYVGWNYEKFVGLRRVGDLYAESAFTSLLLTKLTALTYFVMVFILLIRKIILWFFIIVSPVFPILLMYSVTRNTGKIWIGEFFRWLLYAPIFAIFLKGLVFLWINHIPLFFDNPGKNQADKIIYPTAANILLGGPKEAVTPNNSVNLTETFALYVVALIMLWTVILLPWILLQIFLEYAANVNTDNTAVMRTMVNMIAKQPSSAPGGGSPSPVVGAAGLALSLPFSKKFSIPQSLKSPAGSAKQIPISTATAMPVSKSNVSQVHAQTLAVSNLSLPTMKDIARFETKLLSRNKDQKQEVHSMMDTLQKIAKPANVTNQAERERFTGIREKLVKQKDQGNVLASSILNAALTVTVNAEKSKAQSQVARKATTEQVKGVLGQIANPASATSVVDRQKMSRLNEALQRESTEHNSQIASTVLGVNNNTSTQEVEKIREQLLQAKEQSNSVASAVSSVIATSNASSTQEVQTVLQQIAHPESVVNSADRENFVQLKETLVKESKENNNQLATSILSISSQTSRVDVEKVQQVLTQARESEVASAVISTVSKTVEQSNPTAAPIEHMTSVLQGIANPSSATSVIDSAKYTELHKSLQDASRGGNQLATSLLTVGAGTPVEQIAALEAKLKEAKSQGVPFAAKIADLAAVGPAAGVPAVNNVQTVSKQDYEEVKKTWKENYSNSDVPEGIAGTRTEWIKDDIAKINETIGLLSSGDQEKVTQGLDNVSDILPALMVGGFSQNEIVSYLKAKLEAANEVQQAVVSEEEQKVAVHAKPVQAVQTMAATMEEEHKKPADTSVDSASNAADAAQSKPADQAEKPAELKDVLAEQEQSEKKVVEGK